MTRVALITGGASGMGLAVAKSLALKGWQVAIADLNTTTSNTNDSEKQQAGDKKAPPLSYHKTNVNEYSSLSKTFDSVFQKYGQLDFVFANAGVGERTSFYTKVDDQTMASPPVELDKVIDIDLKSVINTAYLTQHYFRKNPAGIRPSLVFTASIAGIYPVRFCPIYTAAKHGVVGFARAISKHFYENDGIRVNAICPGNVRTNLFKKEEWDAFQMEWIELSQIVNVVEMMVFDETLQGKIIEVAPKAHYDIKQLEYNDPNVVKTLEDVPFDHIGK